MFTDNNSGYAVGDSGIILKTMNAGTTWNTLSSGTTDNLTSIFFTDSNTGYAVGGDLYGAGIILKTINGGTNWSIVSIGANTLFYSVSFTDANTGYVVGGGGKILKTTNGGGPAGINEKPQTTSLKIYPNPATERITIEPFTPESQMNGTLFLYGMTGTELLKQQVKGLRCEIDVSSFPKGIYIFF